MKNLLVLIALSLGFSHGAKAQELARTLSPYFAVENSEPDVEAFPLAKTQVDVNISGVIADVTVKQTYTNTGKVPINARYVFPGSTRAAVYGLRFKVGERAVVAQIKEREQARQVFETAQREGKTATLLEQQRPNVFTMAVANVMPNDQVEVELRYTEMLVPEEGVYSFVYPTTVGPRYSNIKESAAKSTDTWVKSPYLHANVAPKSSFDITVNISGAVPIAGLQSRSHDIETVWQNPALANVSLTHRDATVEDRDFLLDYRLVGEQIQSGLMLYEGETENFFMLTVQPPKRITPEVIAPREYIFVLDVSGSMHGFPLDTAKEVLYHLVGNIKPTDSFNIILFAGDARVLSPKSLLATQANVERALDMLESQSGGGGTELAAALKKAVALPRQEHVSRTVVMVTDGYIAAEREAFELISNHLQDTNFFSFGIGASVNRYLVEGIARVGLGEPFVVTQPNEAKAEGEKLRRYIESPVLTNVTVKAHGFEIYDVEPAAHPDLFAERPVVVIGKWRGKKSGSIAVEGRTATAKFAKRFDVAQEVSHPANAALRQLWARTRIARLSDFEITGD